MDAVGEDGWLKTGVGCSGGGKDRGGWLAKDRCAVGEDGWLKTGVGCSRGGGGGWLAKDRCGMQ